MNKQILLATAFVSALTLSGCGGSDSGNSASESSSDMSAAEAPSNDINLKSEFEYQQKMGNTVEGRSESPDLFKKELGTSVGSTITVPKFYLWNLDSAEWEKGGSLKIYNDDSMGAEFRITCALSSDQGDKIMKNKVRREVDIKGAISSYSSSDGLVIDPCNITRDELDSPKKEILAAPNEETNGDSAANGTEQNQ
jgi:hypothetical protein